VTELEQIRSVLREYLALEAECRPSPEVWRQLRLRKAARATSLQKSHARLEELRARLAAFANAKNELKAIRAVVSAYAEAHASDAKRQCRACDGDGFLAVESTTPHNERLTRDSRVCTYCDGTGVSRERTIGP
jgi:DnaJ-class molecular chaperone